MGSYDTYVLRHLVVDVLVEAFPLSKLVLVFRVDLVFIALNLLEVACHDLRVEVLLLGDLGFVSLQGLPPGDVLGRVSILDHPRVVLGCHIATVMKGLDTASKEGSIAHKTIGTQVNMAV